MTNIRKLLIALLAASTMLSVATIAVKVKTPPPRPPIIRNDDGGWSALPKDKPVQVDYDKVVSSIDQKNLSEDLYFLASPKLEGRMSGKAGNELSASFLEDRYAKLGLKTMRQKFRVGSYNPGPKNERGSDDSENVIAWIEGNDPVLKNEIVVIGAHFDHIGYGPKASQTPDRREIHPGADDNASGTVALLEIARAFSMMKDKVKRTVVFISFSGEEMGLIGSKYYCENPIFPVGSPSMSKHIFMLNMDMLGYLRKGTYLALFNENDDSSPDIDRYIGELNERYTFAKSITGRGNGGSDHAPFYNKKVPVVCLHTGMHKNYHTPDDTADKINYKGMEQITRYAFELSWRVATDPVKPAFNYGGFRPMSYDHDHGILFKKE